MARHIMLVGLPGAGKSTVGRLVADRLGAVFADFDKLIETRAGKSVNRIFADDGEAAFRSLEAAVGAEQLAGPPAVLAPGGGFLADAQQRLGALAKALLVYLETSPAVAAERLKGQGDRPLLKGFDPTLRLTQLLHQRASSYLVAQQRVTTDGVAAAQVAEQVVKLARSVGGW